MFIATALSLRGEEIFLASSPQEAAHLIAKLQAGICRGQRTTRKGIRQDTAAVSAVAPEGESERNGSIAAPQRKRKTTDNKKIRRERRNVQSVVRCAFGAEFVLDPPLGHHTVRDPARERCERGAGR